MDDTRRMLAEVFAQDDLVRRDFACWEAKRQRQQQQQREREQRQAAHATEQRTVRAWLTRTADDDMRTTDFLDERNQAGNNGQQSQPQAATMNDADSANWNSWFIEAFDLRMGRCLEIIGEETRNQTRQMLGKQAEAHGARIDQLEERLDLLEVRVADLEGSGDTQKVVPLLTFKGGRDAA